MLFLSKSITSPKPCFVFVLRQEFLSPAQAILELTTSWDHRLALLCLFSVCFWKEAYQHVQMKALGFHVPNWLCVFCQITNPLGKSVAHLSHL